MVGVRNCARLFVYAPEFHKSIEEASTRFYHLSTRLLLFELFVAPEAFEAGFSRYFKRGLS